MSVSGFMKAGVCVVCVWFSLVVAGCGGSGVERVETGTEAPVFPDCSGCTVPVNIAPLNFCFLKRCDEVEAVFGTGDGTAFSCRGNQYVDIPVRKWRRLLERAAADGGEVVVTVSARNGKRWETFLPRKFRVAPEAIDEWISYRLIYPGYERWAHMGLYQRRLTDFREKVMLDNRLTGNNCMNCHTSWERSPDRFVFHLRGKNGGTVLVRDGECRRIEAEVGGKPVPLVYPAWHPGGRYVAFSSNSTRQLFHAGPEKLVEVYDEWSDVLLYDTETGELVRDSSLLMRGDVFETYPAWSPDGKRLYFCASAAAEMPEEYKSIKYSVCSVGFDARERRFSGPVDTVLSIPDRSVVFPRISPDGRHMVAVALDYGCFPVWHREADLVVWDLKEVRQVAHDANSFDSESFPVWSSNGRWVMFTSRRDDGLFTRLWFAYCGEDGRLCKPFPLPQRGALLRDTRMKSYNTPQFMTGEVTLSQGSLFVTEE